MLSKRVDTVFSGINIVQVFFTGFNLLNRTIKAMSINFYTRRQKAFYGWRVSFLATVDGLSGRCRGSNWRLIGGAKKQCMNVTGAVSKIHISSIISV